jgi:hypothetical protein
VKAAIIPPIPHLTKYGCGQMHLLLAHLMEDKRYVAHYIQQRREGKYLILDNSAHEFKEGCNPEELAAYARVLGVQEVVVPDVLDNGERTVERAIEALETWYEGSSNLMGNLNPTLMYVPQGVTRQEYFNCAHELIDLHLYNASKHHLRSSFVLGISKDYEDFEDGLDDILSTVGNIRNSLWSGREIRMHVHILGWHRKLWVLRDLARLYPWVRSTDSCKPFQYALKGIRLDPNSVPPKYPGRHATAYFQKKLTAEQLVIADHNVAVFAATAVGV